MNIRERAVGDVMVLDIGGRMVLDEDDSDRHLKEMVDGLVSLGRRHLVVNLGNVSQVDSSGLSALVSAHLAVVSRGGRISMVNPTARIRQLLGMTGLNTVLDIVDSEQDAIAALARESAVGT
jgi:anti-anti-sigma factor